MYLALFLTPWMIIYALSGLVLNHFQTIRNAYGENFNKFEKVEERDYTAAFSDDADVKMIGAQILEHLGLGAKMPAKPKSPGRDFSAALRGEPLAWDNVMFYEMETTRAVRTDDWKYVARFPNGPFELYDMKKDPRERFNRFGQPEVIEDLRADHSRVGVGGEGGRVFALPDLLELDELLAVKGADGFEMIQRQTAQGVDHHPRREEQRQIHVNPADELGGRRIHGELA